MFVKWVDKTNSHESPRSGKLPEDGPIILVPGESILKTFHCWWQLNCHPNAAFRHLGANSVVNKYLLPCRCGHQHVVEPRQAGESVSCPCGVVLTIPTLLEMMALEPAPEESRSPTKAVWGWRQGMSFLGIVSVLVAIGLGILFYQWRPVPPIDTIDPEKVQQKARELTPVQTWGMWEGMKRQGLGFVDTRYQADLLNFHIRLVFTIVLASIGIALMAVGLWPVKTADSPPTR
jgi:hypothetical protein